MNPRLAAYGLVALVTWVALLDTYFLFQEGTGIRKDFDFRMMGSIDGYSEAIVVRAADRYAADGFAATMGLPDPSYGGRFPNLGITGPSGAHENDPIYHGDPPGPHWIAGLAFRIWGGENLGRTRLIPVACSIAAAAYFARALAASLGNARALAVFTACAACPMFTNMSNSLYYHSYAQALTLVQIAILLDLFAGESPTPNARPRLILLGLIGFAQGFLSYVHGGSVALAAVPIALITAPDARPIPRERLFWAVAAPAVAFATAHLIHFAQSAAYFGSIRAALDEYAFRSRKTYWLDVEYPRSGLNHLWLILMGLRFALINFLRRTHLFAPTSLIILVLLGAALLVRRAAGTARPGWRWELASRPTRRRLIGLAIAVAAGVSWILLKPNHAIVHLTVVGRTFFLPYLCIALFLAITVRFRGQMLPRPRSRTTRAAS